MAAAATAGPEMGFWEGAEIIAQYTRKQAIEDGVLVDVTEWAGPDQMMGGYRVPVAITQALWTAIEAIPKAAEGIQDVRGRTHDVLWMMGCYLRGAQKRGETTTLGKLTLPYRGTRKRNQILRATVDGDGVTIGFPGDF